MGKDPALLFYPGDYIGGTMGMTFEEKGAYIELLMMQFLRGHLTKRMIDHTVGQLWDGIKDKFLCDNEGLFYNSRLDEEKEKREKYTQSRRNNKTGRNQYSDKLNSKKVHTSAHMTNHMENENENRNKMEKEGESEGEENICEMVKDSILEYFGFSRLDNRDKLIILDNFLIFLKNKNKYDSFLTQIHAYKVYKKRTKDIVHGFKGFIGSVDKGYEDGGWNQENWVSKVKTLSTSQNKNEYTIDQNITNNTKRLKF